MRNKPNYVGIDEDVFGGMTPTGTIIRDAWVFGIIPDSENRAGWTVQGIQSLYDKVSAAWEPYGHLASNLPPDCANGTSASMQRRCTKPEPWAGTRN